MRAFAASLLLCAGLAGCVSVPVEPLARTELLVARAGSDVTLEWQSVQGMLYTISYSDTLGANARWMPLPNGLRLRGTGGRMHLSDRVPERRPRFYNVSVEPTR